MVKHIDPDMTLLKMPSLRALKSFVAAAKYQSFTRAAEALCVSQAAISRQIRELEAYLEVELFKRVGRAVELTEVGAIFFDAAQVSFVNISQAAERIRTNNAGKRVLTLCCSPAFSALWLSARLPRFFSENPDIDLNLITTQNFLSMEPGILPDIFITKMAKIQEGYRSYPLFHDVIYPVCTPQYLAAHPDLSTLRGLRDGVLLNLSPYGRSQVAEHVDWGIWLALNGIDMNERSSGSPHLLNANDYNLIITMVLTHQGVALGWNHLVANLVESGTLIRPVAQELVLTESQHYMTIRQDRENYEACCRLRDWILSQLS